MKRFIDICINILVTFFLIILKAVYSDVLSGLTGHLILMF